MKHHFNFTISKQIRCTTHKSSWRKNQKDFNKISFNNVKEAQKILWSRYLLLLQTVLISHSANFFNLKLSKMRKKVSKFFFLNVSWISNETVTEQFVARGYSTVSEVFFANKFKRKGVILELLSKWSRVILSRVTQMSLGLKILKL